MALLGILLAGTNFASIPLLFLILWFKPYEDTRKFLIGGLAYSLLLGIFTAFSFGGAFGPGAIPYVSSFLLCPLAMVLVLLIGIFYFRAKKAPRERIVYAFGSFVIILMQISPFLGHTFIGGYCDKKTQRTGEQIILAVNEYVVDQGQYPESLDAITPAYILEIPEASCFGKLSPSAHFDIKHCEVGPILVITTFDLAKDMRYFFKTGEWSSISFLDGACSFLE